MIRRPIITEKGLGVKETQHTVVFEVAKDATKTEIKEAVQRDFQGEGRSRAHGDLSRQVPPPGPRRRLSQRLEEGVRPAGAGRKDDRVRRESVDRRIQQQEASEARGNDGTENI